MLAFESVVLYVKDIEVSKNFYSKVFDTQGDVLSPTFAFFPLFSDFSIGLKQLDQAIPPANIAGGGSELSFTVKNVVELNQLYEEWKSRDVRFAQEPTELVFGTTFVAIDPDKHRIRVFAPKAQ